MSLLILALLTAALAGLQRFINVETVTIIYLIAVLYAATHWLTWALSRLGGVE